MARTQTLSDVMNDRARAVARDLVKRHGSQVALAAALGIKQGALSQFLTGQVGASLQTITAIGSLAGVPLSTLLDTSPGAAPVLADAPESLRDRFAMAAMTGFMAAGKSIDHSAATAYTAADAMLAARKAVA